MCDMFCSGGWCPQQCHHISFTPLLLLWCPPTLSQPLGNPPSSLPLSLLPSITLQVQCIHHHTSQYIMAMVLCAFELYVQLHTVCYMFTSCSNHVCVWCVCGWVADGGDMDGAEGGVMEAGLLPVPKKPPKGFKTDVTKLRLGGGQVWQDHSLEDWDTSELVHSTSMLLLSSPMHLYSTSMHGHTHMHTRAHSHTHSHSITRSHTVADFSLQMTLGYLLVILATMSMMISWRGPSPSTPRSSRPRSSGTSGPRKQRAMVSSVSRTHTTSYRP